MVKCFVWFLLALIISSVGQQIISSKETEIFHFRNDLQSLLTKAFEEKPYQSVFLLKRNFSDCVDENLLRNMTVPIINWSMQHEPIYLKGNYSSEMLSIICLNSTKDKDLVRQLAQNLQHMRDSRIIALINEEFVSNKTKEENNLLELFTQCQALKILNINVLHRNCFRLQLYHSYTQFPQLQLETHSLNSNAGITLFPNRLRNLQGKSIITLPDLIEPRTMLYTDLKDGRQKMTGYIGKLMNCFARHHNCTLQLAFNMTNDQVIYLADIRLAARNGSIDIGSSLSTAQRELNIHEYTYPIEMAKWLTMVPEERAIPVHLLLLSVFRVNFILIIMAVCGLLSLLLTVQRMKIRNDFGTLTASAFFNDSAFRGMLGQSFRMSLRPDFQLKFVYVIIFVAGLFITTTFAANLMKLLTTPPTLKEIASFDDALVHNMKILLAREELSNVLYYTGAEFWQRYESLFTILETYGEFQEYRRTMDTKFAYTITTSSWPVVEEQQKYFARKMFRLSPELFYCNCILFGLPVNENSFYKEPLNRFIMRTKDTGLFRYWFSSTFYDMVALGRVSFEDLSTPYGYRSFRVGDLYWIWVLYGAAMGMSILEFVAERFLFTFERK